MQAAGSSGGTQAQKGVFKPTLQGLWGLANRTEAGAGLEPFLSFFFFPESAR